MHWSTATQRADPPLRSSRPQVLDPKLAVVESSNVTVFGVKKQPVDPVAHATLLLIPTGTTFFRLPGEPIWARACA